MKKTHFKKSLGQNFLRDLSVIDDIITLADTSLDDVIFEVGPGDGALTQKLLATGAQVIALEIDQDLLENLKNKFTNEKNFTLLHEDIRRFNLPTYLKEKNISKYHVVANLPYYITSSIMRYFLESERPPESMTVMVQKEVGQRMCANAGSLSILGVSVQYYGSPAIVLEVSAAAFEPVPKVDSAIVQIKNISVYGGHDEAYTKQFFRLVKAGFSARRKMLAKNLMNSLNDEVPSKETLEQQLEAIGVKKTARAQELTLEQWHQLTRVFDEDGGVMKQ